MKVSEIMAQVIGPEYLADHPDTCDTLKAGSADREVKKIAAAFSATPEVLRAAKAWGADLLIVHEPTFYNHPDKLLPGRQTELKKAMVDETGLAVWRYHDSMHRRGVDEVSLDLIERMGWVGDFDGQAHIVLAKPESVRAIARKLRRTLKLGHVRVIGNAALKDVTDISLGLGDSGIYDTFLADEARELVITGEACEWKSGETVREAGQLGLRKVMLVLGHCGSEKLSMERLARRIDGKFDGAPARYFDTGELYKYM